MAAPQDTIVSHSAGETFVLSACLRCRKLKRKCDRAYPVSHVKSRCQVTTNECVYDSIHTTKAETNEELAKRVQDLENMMAQLTDQMDLLQQESERKQAEIKREYVLSECLDAKYPSSLPMMLHTPTSTDDSALSEGSTSDYSDNDSTNMTKSTSVESTPSHVCSIASVKEQRPVIKIVYEAKEGKHLSYESLQNIAPTNSEEVSMVVRPDGIQLHTTATTFAGAIDALIKSVDGILLPTPSASMRASPTPVPVVQVNGGETDGGVSLQEEHRPSNFWARHGEGYIDQVTHLVQAKSAPEEGETDSCLVELDDMVMLIDKCIDVFFQCSFFFRPILYEPLYRKMYQEWRAYLSPEPRRDQPPSDPSVLALTYSLVSIIAHHAFTIHRVQGARSLPDPILTGDYFYCQARKLLDDLFDEENLWVACTVYYLSLFCRNSMRPELRQKWTTYMDVGIRLMLAIRANRTDRTGSTWMEEVERRLWNQMAQSSFVTAYVNSHYVSPISQDSLQLISRILPGENTAVHEFNTYCNALLKLRMVVYDVFSNDSALGQVPEQVDEANKALSNVLEDLPPALQLDTYSDSSPRQNAASTLRELQACFVRLVYLAGAINLHKQLLRTQQETARTIDAWTACTDCAEQVYAICKRMDELQVCVDPSSVNFYTISLSVAAEIFLINATFGSIQNKSLAESPPSPGKDSPDMRQYQFFKNSEFRALNGHNMVTTVNTNDVAQQKRATDYLCKLYHLFTHHRPDWGPNADELFSSNAQILAKMTRERGINVVM
ncbi:hypothetical protein BZG36_03560 [Bifiguratus adelaidae]|uniref:Zn(2)-C6 fungal-type domain-containing protein n=1 Tax=Bifiguratus adelaidae TaxID=1938954 RepID=A0A261Y0C3_9FUNG|nr:hypothetical protein BZG36_03560 [Bifiguratus adelaidae]